MKNEKNKKNNCCGRKLFTGTKSKLLYYDEAVSGAIVEYAFLLPKWNCKTQRQF